MQIGMMNNPANDLYEEIKFAGENRFDFIDLTIEPPRAQINDVDIEKTVILLSKYKLKIIGHTNFYIPWATPIKKLKDASITELTEQFELFGKLGAKLISIHPHWYQPNSSKSEIVVRIISSLITLSQIAEKNNLRLMLEHQPTGFLNTPMSLQPIFAGVRELLFHLDVGHAQVAGGEQNLTDKFLDRFGDKLAHVHFSDNKGKFDDHLPLGAGIIDWSSIVSRLKELKYDGMITLEIWSKDRHYLLYSRDQLKKLWNDQIN